LIAVPPRSICLLRLSALGDVTHVLPLVRTLQQFLPGVQLSWIIGRTEHALLRGVEGVEFIEFDKRSGVGGLLALRRAMRARRFDALLLLQVAARANLLSLCVRARRRIGFDRARSKDLHGAVIRERIRAASGLHVLDAIGSFCESFGLRQDSVRWDLPIADDARQWAAATVPAGAPVLMISPSSSHALRNWRAERYAAVADHAASRGFRVVLCGGRGTHERAMADAIRAGMQAAAIDLVGRDTLAQLPALLERADLLMSPDSGPMHIANALGVKVLGLHAASNPARSGPYSDRRYCVDRYDDAARRFLGRPAVSLAWGTKIERKGVMDLVTVEDAVAAFERYVADRPAP